MSGHLWSTWNLFQSRVWREDAALHLSITDYTNTSYWIIHPFLTNVKYHCYILYCTYVGQFLYLDFFSFTDLSFLEQLVHCFYYCGFCYLGERASCINVYLKFFLIILLCLFFQMNFGITLSSFPSYNLCPTPFP